MTSKVTLVLFVAVICLGLAAAEIPVDCCLRTTNKRFPKNFRIVSYKLQTRDMGCSIDATVFLTRSGLSLCVPHPSQKQWVERIITHLTHK